MSGIKHLFDSIICLLTIEYDSLKINIIACENTINLCKNHYILSNTQCEKKTSIFLLINNKKKLLEQAIKSANSTFLILYAKLINVKQEHLKFSMFKNYPSNELENLYNDLNSYAIRSFTARDDIKIILADLLNLIKTVQILDL